MAVRTGLQYLVDKIDSYIPSEATTFISDDEKQEILDRNRSRVVNQQLDAEPTYSNNDYTYLYYSGPPNLEKDTSGSAYFRMYDSGGTAIGTASFTPDYALSLFTFATDQDNAARYIDAYSYDIYAAMADIWEVILANTSALYDVQIEGRRYSRSQWFDHCQGMIKLYKSKSDKYGTFQVPVYRSDFK